jgi:hypothetical protein
VSTPGRAGGPLGAGAAAGVGARVPLRARYFAPEVATRLAALRVLVGLFGTVFLVVRADYLFDVARLPAARFAPVGVLGGLDEPLPVWLVRLVVAGTIALAVAFTVGWRHRVTGPAYAVALLAVTTFDNSWQHIAHTENLMTLHTIVLAVAPAADVWSLDARRVGRTAPLAAADERYGWPVRLISVITVCTYVLAGWAKLRNGGVDWLTGDVLRNQIAHDNVRKAVLGDRWSPVGAWLSSHAWVFPPMALASVVVELGALVALTRGRLRTLWVAAAWGFHLGVLVLMAILFAYPLSGVAFASFGRPDALWVGVRARAGRRRVSVPVP